MHDHFHDHEWFRMIFSYKALRKNKQNDKHMKLIIIIKNFYLIIVQVTFSAFLSLLLHRYWSVCCLALRVFTTFYNIYYLFGSFFASSYRCRSCTERKSVLQSHFTPGLSLHTCQNAFACQMLSCTKFCFWLEMYHRNMFCLLVFYRVVYRVFFFVSPSYLVHCSLFSHLLRSYVSYGDDFILCLFRAFVLKF